MLQFVYARYMHTLSCKDSSLYVKIVRICYCKYAFRRVLICYVF